MVTPSWIASAQRGWRATFLKGEQSYSLEGEDRILARFFDAGQMTRHGFYVDVGAHDPMRYSNTYLFYRRGWRGVNIDAYPGSMKLFNKYRGRDANIESGIGVTAGTMPFYVFNEPALNSFCQELSEARHAADTSYRIENVIDVAVSPLSEVLRGRLPRNSDLPSFLTVDVEGKDLDVLRSNDWSTFRPTYVLAESHGETMEQTARGPLSTFMTSVGYVLVAKSVNTVFYQRTDGREASFAGEG